ncbi:hypothetical protein K443DRAFT_92334 [Laccaria amethystina LaAM-08-1]|uniref:Uncharacterized protein n=1 Tax=Laccaria amethystina LaAM-08-1 TaxID=1095629 RepID=A0A0C9WY88_9AGAR|nr:hypothetical protein K443DRAFT_92334 [Laccaria amethystina LaAM-08-1]
MLLCLLPSFPSPSLNVNVLTTLQSSPLIPHSPPAPTPRLEQPQGTQHGASPNVSFPTRSAPLSPTSFGRSHDPTGTEWKKKIEDEVREIGDLAWQISESDQQEIGADSTFVLTTLGTIGK